MNIRDASLDACFLLTLGSLSIVFAWWFQVYKLPELLPTREPMNTFLTIMPYCFGAVGCISTVSGVAGYIIATRRHRRFLKSLKQA